MNDKPLVSVVIPAWNAARFLPDALASIHAQKYEPIEIIVVDDGSTDETVAVAEHHEVRLLKFPHRGLTPTRLAGIEAARGDLIAFLDADDVWSNTKLQLQLELVAKNSDTMIVNGYTQLMRLVDGRKWTFENWGEPVLAPSFGSALFRRQAFERLGLMAYKNDAAADLDWFMPAREMGLPLLIHSDVVQYYRRHDRNHSNNHPQSKQALLHMLRDSLARRKELGVQGLELPALNHQEKET